MQGDDQDDNSVGYKKPPIATRFKPGRSGNPKGRPKHSRNIGKAIQNIYTESILIRQGATTHRISRLEAVLLRQLEKSLKGDQRATQTVLNNAKEIGLFRDSNWPTDLKIGDLTDKQLLELLELIDMQST